MRRIAAGLLALAAAAPALAWAAEVIQAPEGGRAFLLGKGRVWCGSLPEGWGSDSERRAVRPPRGDAGTGARAAGAGEVKVADSPEACAASKAVITLVATERWPEIDPASVVFHPDEGRLELKGDRLEQVAVGWQAGDKSGQETCLAPTAATGAGSRRPPPQLCVVPVERGLPSDAALRWAPARGRFGADVTTYDQNGQRAEPATFELRPARVIINQVLSPTRAVDVSAGTGRIALAHPRAVSGVDCGLARCEVSEGAIVVRGVPTPATHLTMQLRLAPRIQLAREGKLETSASVNLPLLHCPLTLLSGTPLRDADDVQILVRMDPRCSRETRLRWTVGAEPVEVVRSVRVEEALLVLLRAGRIASGNVTITAARADSEGGIIGSVTSKTVPAPRPRAAIELPGYGKIDFVPTNRPAQLTVHGAGERARLVPLPVDGVYTVRGDKGRHTVRGEENVGGFVSLRFGHRIEGLPGEFASTNLAVLAEQVQRPVREASVPAAFGPTKDRALPLIEFQCAGENGDPETLVPGKPGRIVYESRDTCRVTLHQDRLRPEDGLQEVVLEIDVSRARGGARPEASVKERLVLRPGGESRTFYLKGVTEQFDHVVVRASHVVDETRYVLSPTSRQAPPSVQWSARVEGGWARLYATVAIPAGLYRMNEPTGQLTLNFGVLSRLTWLDRNGKEGLLGLELGLMGVGLIPQRPSGTTAIPRTLAAVAGFGLRVDLGAGAAVGIHLWGAYEFRSEYRYGGVQNDPNSGTVAPHWALFFGPSIAIGNAGTNL
jgi:hypothetical protein